jgi:1-acyl-sn-glycerol-3-phosphate acyltransferase
MADPDTGDAAMADPDTTDPAMADPDSGDPQTGKTVELALSDLRGGPPAAPRDLREQLPGVEPQRRVTDWGRSERLEGLFDRTVLEFLYRYWFRVEVEGLENVPDEGGALLVANHAGAVPPDAAMIAKAVREEHRRARVVHLTTERNLTGLPGLGMLVTKVGAVPAHPANLHRLLFDEGELVLVFPEGAKAARKSIKDRYRLRRFASGGFVQAALGARVPIVPVAVVGAEEAVPVLARLSPLRRFSRLPRVPTPAIPVMPAIPLPAKFRIRFLEPVDAALRSGSSDDPAGAQSLAHEIQALIQENLLEMVAARRSVWLG